MPSSDTVTKILDSLRASGHRSHAVVDDRRFGQLVKGLAQDPNAVETPDSDLRFIEGLADLPIGFLRSFHVTFDGSSTCGCGRQLSAADVVGSALRAQVHPRDLITRTLAGMQNVVELSDGGRRGACLACGREFLAASYWTNGYMYA